ncbi:MAG: TfoX/Sxy family protein [Cyclobacteriaceae bacterium]|nr:TfoX/Sxy family protein [Cyclobacteriaceae bacterium]
MAYDEILEDRVQQILHEKNIPFTKKKMMGGLTFMVDDKMCVGIVKNTLMARIDPEKYGEALGKEGCREMDFTGRPMKGFVLVEPAGIDMDRDLEYWINLALDYNPKAKKSRK